MSHNKDNRPEAVLDRVLEKAGILPHQNKSVEEVKILTFRDIKEYWGLHIGPKSSQDMQEKVLYKIYEKLRQTSQEREREIVEEIKNLKLDLSLGGNQWGGGYNESLDKLLKILQEKYNITLTNPNKD